MHFVCFALKTMHKSAGRPVRHGWDFSLSFCLVRKFAIRCFSYRFKIGGKINVIITVIRNGEKRQKFLQSTHQHMHTRAETTASRSLQTITPSTFQWWTLLLLLLLRCFFFFFARGAAKLEVGILAVYSRWRPPGGHDMADWRGYPYLKPFSPFLPLKLNRPDTQRFASWPHAAEANICQPYTPCVCLSASSARVCVCVCCACQWKVSNSNKTNHPLSFKSQA